MKEEKEEELEEAKELFKDGLKKIFKATKKISKEIVEGFKEGYAKDVTKKENPEKWLKLPVTKCQKRIRHSQFMRFIKVLELHWHKHC